MKQSPPKQFLYNEQYGKIYVHASARELSHSCSLHSHDYYEIELCTGGKAVHKINGVEYPFFEGAFILLQPSDFHEVLVQEPISYFNVSFSSLAINKEYLYTLIKKEEFIYGTLSKDVFDFLSVVCKNAAKESEEAATIQTKETLQALLHVLLAYLSKTQQSAADRQKRSVSLEEAIEYLHAHFADAPTLKEIALHAGLQPNYFCRKFKQETGKTYVEYLNALKIEHAKKMLQACNLSITEIAFSSGFFSSTSFLRAFKKSTGFSPSLYRKTFSKNLLDKS